jgi:hypothetical protein
MTYYNSSTLPRACAEQPDRRERRAGAANLVAQRMAIRRRRNRAIRKWVLRVLNDARPDREPD